MTDNLLDDESFGSIEDRKEPKYDIGTGRNEDSVYPDEFYEEQEEVE